MSEMLEEVAVKITCNFYTAVKSLGPVNSSPGQGVESPDGSSQIPSGLNRAENRGLNARHFIISSQNHCEISRAREEIVQKCRVHDIYASHLIETNRDVEKQ
jgi:hypothetical protein